MDAMGKETTVNNQVVLRLKNVYQLEHLKSQHKL